jgi:hypothetical protein
MKLLAIILSCLALSCSLFETKEEQDPKPADLNNLKAQLNDAEIEISALIDQDDKWLAYDCDGMIWTGKYAAVGDQAIDITAAEYPDTPGKFGRRPPNPNWCWEDGADHGSKTTWSRDMAKAGLFVYGWLKKDLNLMARHADYVKENNWQAGEGDPSAIDRTIYTPALVGLMYQIIYALGGENSANKYWPDVYPSGLSDYQLHLQMVGIWFRGEIDKELKLLDIKGNMYNRVVEAVEKEPNCPFYNYLDSRYTDGDYTKPIGLLLDDNRPDCSYIRCSDDNKCFLAEWIWAANLIIREYDNAADNSGSD